MTYVSEILFVDPAVDDIKTLVCNLRPGVEARVLDREIPAAQQIAAALDGVHDLDAVHVIAHGTPGRVNFSAGDWSLAMLDDEAENLAAIGRALGPHGELRLWSCETGAGEIGAAFVARLAWATGAHVDAASRLIGNAALGGSWELTTAAQPPLTGAGVTGYAAVLAIDTWNVSNTTGNWGQANEWNYNSGGNGNDLPANGDNVVFNPTNNASYTITLNVNTANLGSLTINDGSSSTSPTTVTVAVGNFALTVDNSAGNDNITLNPAHNNSDAAITIANGSITAGNILLTDAQVAGSSTLTGFGTVTAGNITGSGNATITASGGTLDLVGTVSGLTLAIGNTSGSDLEIAGTATTANAITINNTNQTLEIANTGHLTITPAENITAGTIKLDGPGAILTDANGINISSGAMLTGSGNVTVNLSGNGTITANGGTLDLQSSNLASGLTLAIANISGSDLEIANTITTNTNINNFGSTNQKLEIASNGNLTITTAETITNGATIQLDGGSANLIDSNGLTITNASLTGAGEVFANISGNGTITANNGTLILENTVAASTLAVNSNSTLQLVGNATVNNVAISGSNETLIEFWSHSDHQQRREHHQRQYRNRQHDADRR